MFRSIKNINAALTQKTVSKGRQIIGEEVKKTADNILPKIIGGAFIALIFLASIPPQKITTIPPQTINVIYIGK